MLDRIITAPLKILDIITLSFLIISFSGLLVSYIFKVNEKLKLFWLSLLIALTPAISFTLAFSGYYYELWLFLIYYPCFILICYATIPTIRHTLTQILTHTDTHIEEDEEDPSDEPEELQDG
jgi:hypothetical protein